MITNTQVYLSQLLSAKKQNSGILFCGLFDIGGSLNRYLLLNKMSGCIKLKSYHKASYDASKTNFCGYQLSDEQ